MRKITVLSLLLAAGFTASAQDYYQFTATQVAYNDIEEPISLNGSAVWNDETFGEITIPFNFTLKGITVNRFAFVEDNFLLLAPDANMETYMGVYYLPTSDIYIQDREYSTGVSASGVNYKVEGTAGNRILKMEIKNAGLQEVEGFDFQENYYYLNYQIWLYESDQSIEYRFGSSNLNEISSEDLFLVANEEGFIMGFTSDFENGDTNPIAHFIMGDIADPVYNEYSIGNPAGDDIYLSGYPANGTMYRFGPTETVGTDLFETTTFKLYPNPVSGVLTITAKDLTDQSYTITDITGKKITENKFASTTTMQVNVEGLVPGIYYINTNGQHLKFIKN